jgi:sugar lactone lactonase YvrE
MVEELNGSLEIVLDLDADLGEGPFWDAATAILITVDSTKGRIHQFDPASGDLARIEVGQIIGAALPRRSGGFAVSAEEGLLGVDADGHVGLLVPIETDQPTHRMNDAKCDSRGRLFSGTLSHPFERGVCALYRVDPDLGVTCVLPGVTVSNGIGWSPDETIFYYVDTAKRAIDCFDYDIETGAITNQRVFAVIERGDGFPDGLTVDAEGHVWLALYLGSEVRRYAPSGELVARVTMPVAGVTSCNFGGASLTDLYITTAQFGVPPETLAGERHAGALYRCRPGVAGMPGHYFAG